MSGKLEIIAGQVLRPQGPRKLGTFSEIVGNASLALPSIRVRPQIIRRKRVKKTSRLDIELLKMVGSRTGTQITHQPILPSKEEMKKPEVRSVPPLPRALTVPPIIIDQDVPVGVEVPLPVLPPLPGARERSRVGRAVRERNAAIAREKEERARARDISEI